MIHSNYIAILHCFWDTSHQNWYDPSRSSKVKPHGTIWTSMYHFLYMTNSNYMAILLHFRDTSHQNLSDLDMTLQGHPRSDPMVPFEPPHMTSYTWSIVTTWLSCTISEIQAIKIWLTLIWPFKVIQGQTPWCHLNLHIWLPIHDQ